MKHIKIPVWEFPDIKTHVKTIFKISSDADMSNLVVNEEITNTGEGNNLTNYFWNFSIPDDEIYYATATRVFNDDGEEILGPIPIHPDTDVLPAMSNYEYAIETPGVLVEDFFSSSSTVTITSSPIRAGGVSHKYSNFIVEDETGRTLFKELLTDNLTSLTIDKDLLDIENVKSLYFKVAHIDGNGKHSDYGVFRIEDVGGNVTIKNRVVIHPAIREVVTLVVSSSEYIPDKVSIYTEDGVEVESYEVDYVVGSSGLEYVFTIPEDTLLFGETYTIRVYERDRINDNSYNTIQIKTIPYSVGFNINKDYNYNLFTKINYDIETQYIFEPTKGYIEVIGNNTFIAFDKNDKTLKFYSIDKKGISLAGYTNIQITNEPDLTKPYNIILINNSYILILYYTINNDLIALTLLLELKLGNVFKIEETVILNNVNPDVGELFTTITRADDIVYFISSNVTEELSFYSLNYKTHEKEELPLPENPNLIDNGLTHNVIGNIVLFSGNYADDNIDSLYHVYDPKEKLWRIGDVLPNEIQHLNYKPLLMKNGKIGIFHTPINNIDNNEPYTFYYYTPETDIISETYNLGVEYEGEDMILKHVDGRILFLKEDNETLLQTFS